MSGLSAGNARVDGIGESTGDGSGGVTRDDGVSRQATIATLKTPKVAGALKAKTAARRRLTVEA